MGEVFMDCIVFFFIDHILWYEYVAWAKTNEKEQIPRMQVHPLSRGNSILWPPQTQSCV